MTKEKLIFALGFVGGILFVLMIEKPELVIGILKIIGVI